jgi:peptidoglycan/LPS O-acetylase OafA/YrhL
VVLGAIVTRVSLYEYFVPADRSPFARDTPFSFFWRNSLLLFGLDFYLPGVFETNILPRAVNGSLWTLPHEVKLYIQLAIVALCCGFRTRIMRGLLVGATLGLVLLGMRRPLLPIWLDHHFLTFGIVFAAGVAVWLVECRFGLRAATTGFVAVALILAVSGHIETAALVVAPAVCVMLNAVRLPRWMTPRIDISYGVYLYAFPVQQVFAMWTQNFWLATACAVAVTTLLAFLSATFVEQPALGLRGRVMRIAANGRNAPSKIIDTKVADAEVAAAIAPRT